MATAIPAFLEGQTYVPVRKHGESIWFDETRAGSTLKEAVSDIDNLKTVLLFDNGAIKDVSVEAARLWFDLNRDECETVFDIPPFIHEQIHNEVYDAISGSRYEAHCTREHEAGRAVI